MYTALANVERDPERAQIFNELAEAELRHATKWGDLVGDDRPSDGPAPPTMKVRALGWTARLIGTKRVLPVLLRLEAKELDAYVRDPEAREVAREERIHAQTLRTLAHGAPVIGTPARGRGGAWRAAVLGVNDGLVSNFSLVTGVAGGTANLGNTNIVLLAGTAGLLAGAFSMAAGEYISMRTQRDLYEHDLEKERIELLEWPEEEEEELFLIYRAKGLTESEARRVAQRVMADPRTALDTMAREELGLDPSELGTPWGAAASSFFAFVGGALVPLLPYALGAGDSALAISAISSAAALAIVGSALAAISGRSPAWGGLRMLLAGGAAASVTYGVGRLLGVTVLS